MYEGEVEIGLFLRLSSDTRSPEELSVFLGLQCNKSHLKGELLTGTTKAWDANVWELVERVKVDFSLACKEFQPALNRLLDRVEPSRRVFVELAQTCDAKLVVAIHSDGYPGMGLDRKLLSRLAALGVSLDFDLYCDPRTTDDTE